MEDLVRYAAIFMNNADGSVLSRAAVNEMARDQHMMKLVSPNADTMFNYGLGWDAVDLYPFNRYGIKALSKGGDTATYHSNLTVLPEYNLAVAVSASGNVNHAQLIAQEIILAVLKEEGLIPQDASPSIDGAIAMPSQNLQRARIPESFLTYAGVYDGGIFGWWNVSFNANSLILTPIGVRNERPQEYIYNSDGEFVSTNGDYVGIISGNEIANGISTITFTEGKYILTQTYQDFTGLSQNAFAIPFAEKIEENSVPASVMEAWKARNDNEYLLVSEKHTSIGYFTALAKTLTDDRVPGYVTSGIYKPGERGISLNGARIVDEFSALGFQSTPTMSGRDINNIRITVQNGVEYLEVNNDRYISASAAGKFSEAGGRVVIGAETVWFNIDSDSSGQRVSITTPENGSWFVYDDKMNCIATSLELNPRNTITLPQNGRIAFAGEAGAEFVLR
jgi:hypothetical protein